MASYLSPFNLLEALALGTRLAEASLCEAAIFVLLPRTRLRDLANDYTLE